LDAALGQATTGRRFSYFDWEVQHLLGAATQFRLADDTDAASVVAEYLALYSVTAPRRAELRRLGASGSATGAELAALRAEVAALDERLAALSEPVETLLARQIRAVLDDQGIRGPADRWLARGPRFPPLWFEITQPPHVLVVSPRDSISRLREVLLVPDLSVAEMEAMEARIEGLGYSALVVRLGGFGGLYPSLVAESASLSFLVQTATEEWLHQYLAFTPLGFRYVLHLLGVARSYEVVTLNETTAPVISEEICEEVLARYYPAFLAAESLGPETGEDPDAFDFAGEMRAIRLRVDKLLAQGRVDEAEAYMAERRDYLAEHGYYIRKLNQAYFAFHGTYAAEPTAVDPIGEEVKALRARSASLSAFLNRMAGITSRQELRSALGRTE